MTSTGNSFGLQILQKVDQLCHVLDCLSDRHLQVQSLLNKFTFVLDGRNGVLAAGRFGLELFAYIFLMNELALITFLLFGL